MCEDYYFEPPEPPLPTALYGFAPQGLGTGQIESLQGYLLALARAHRVAPRQLVSQVLYPLLPPGISPLQFTFSWRAQGGQLMHVNKLARQWLDVLQRATGREELAKTTMTPLQLHVSGEGMMATSLRHCHKCYSEDIKQGRVPYRRLLWSFKTVTCCPIHHVNLIESNCGKPTIEHLPARLRRQMGGVCQCCSSVGFNCIESVDLHSSESEIWLSEQYQELVARLSEVESTSMSDLKVALINHSARSKGGIAGMAARAALNKSTLWRFLHLPSARLSLKGMTKLAAGEGWSVAGLLCADLTSRDKPVKPRFMKRDRVYVKVDRVAVKTQLEEALKSEAPTSLLRLQKEIGVTYKRMAQIFPGLCEQIQAKSTATRRTRVHEIRQQALDQAESVISALIRNKQRLTLRNAGSLDGTDWFPRQLRARIFLTLREDFGTKPFVGLCPSLRFGSDMRYLIEEASKRVRAQSIESHWR